MEKRILFIQESPSFLINAIITALTKHDFHCGSAAFNIDEISSIVDKFDCIFINVEKDTSFHHVSELVFLKDQASFNDKKCMIMGMPNDITDCLEILTDTSIIATFERPINTRDVVEKVIETFDVVVDKSGRKTILVVDDSGTFLHAIRTWLDPVYKVIMVSSATNAISYLATNNPDLILLDYEMPVCSGPKLLEMIRADKSNANIPVIFLTGKGDRESVQKVIALHPQGYLLKTITRPDMLKALEDFFAKYDEEQGDDTPFDAMDILSSYINS
ncbi:MAG: response regulator [Lachnospiraceae bacterium]|nr:response regulator [Lachnospiraceae bacterium]